MYGNVRIGGLVDWWIGGLLTPEYWMTIHSVALRDIFVFAIILLLTDYCLRITDYGLRATDYGLVETGIAHFKNWFVVQDDFPNCERPG